MAEFLKCPNCGNPDFEVMDDGSGRLKCTACGTLTLPDQAHYKKPKKAAAQAEIQPAPVEQSVQTKSSGCEITGFLIVMCFFVAWLVTACVVSNSFNAEITTIGQYSLPGLNCGKDQIQLDWGFPKTPPVYTVVFTSTVGNKWNISENTINAIKAGPRVNEYIWVHCVNSANKPDYYINHFWGIAPIPQNGQEIVFRDPFQLIW